MDRAYTSTKDEVVKPGVYVFWNKSEVIKVGRHLVNSRMRALQHIKADTGGIMKKLKNSKTAKLILFNVKNEKDFHWVASLEIYLELNLNPKIKAHRIA